jgi:tetratricopeptide (TPR) repeat protein
MLLTARSAKITLLFLGALLLLSGAAGAGLHAWASSRAGEAERLIGRQEYREAYPCYVDALKVWRWSAATELLAARTARRASMYDEAKGHLARCQDLAGKDKSLTAAVSLERLLTSVQNGELDQNDIILWGLVKKNDPDSVLILEAMVRGYTLKLRLGPALKCLNLLLEKDPDNVNALFDRGRILEGTAGPTDALKDYRRAVELRPDRDDIRIKLARLLLMDNPKEAMQHFQRLADAKPDDPELLLDLARAYRFIGKADEAAELVEKILKNDPENAFALSEKGALLAATGKAEEGEALLRRAIARDPFSVDIHYQLYLCLGLLKGRDADRDAAKAEHDRLKAERDRLGQILTVDMSKDPENPNLSYELGMIYYKRGYMKGAMFWLNNALKYDPGHQPTLRALFEHFKKTGDTEKAEKFRGSLNSKDKQ